MLCATMSSLQDYLPGGVLIYNPAIPSGFDDSTKIRFSWFRGYFLLLYILTRIREEIIAHPEYDGLCIARELTINQPTHPIW